MSRYFVRSDLSRALPEEETFALDWAPGKPTATVQIGRRAGARFLQGWRAPREALDVFLLGAAAYCADKTSLRESAEDRWTREINVDLPVANVDEWASGLWSPVLNFLTGDHWTVQPYAETRSPLADVPGVPEAVSPVGEVDAVCLFSGGLDSLTGAIDLLEEHSTRRLCLLSHHEGDKASTSQQALIAALRGHYGNERVISRRLFLRPAPAVTGQSRPLPEWRENTTRARSLLFLTAGLALAASVGPTVPVYIPENGFIGINVPLTRARSGSYSTRTTHPHFIAQLQRAVAAVGVANPILNPFRLRSKGEILVEASNHELLKRLAPMSISCSHPEAARYVNRQQGNCGYCFPCLIRRSSMAQVGWDRGDDYAWDALTGEGLLNRETQRAADLRAVINGVYDDRPDREIFRNGPVPSGEHRDFLRVWRAGLEELRSWLSSASGATKKLLNGLA